MSSPTARIIRIFVSSPADVAEERKVLSEVVESINRTDGQYAGFRLELFRWEDDVIPHIGPTPQFVVDAQTPTYDIYLGIMSTRFGTPTGRYGSGTEKEYEDALESWKAARAPWLTFYFDDAPTLSSRPDDVKQYHKVCEFRERMQEQGLYATYMGVRGSAESFFEKVSTHLRQVAREVLSLQEKPSVRSPQNDRENWSRTDPRGTNGEGKDQIISIVRSDAEPRLHDDLLCDLRRELASGKLKRSELGPLVHEVLDETTGLETASDYDPSWIIAGISASDHYFPPIRFSAGQRDWQRDFAKIAVPILAGVARSLRQSAEAQATILHLCTVLAARLRLQLKWPDDPDDSNDLRNAIYLTSLRAAEVESDDALVEIQKLLVVGPG